MVLDRLIGRIQDPDSTTSKELFARANEISQKLKIKPSVALDLLLGNYGLHKTPKIRFCQHDQSTTSHDSDEPQINSYQDALRRRRRRCGRQNDRFTHLSRKGLILST